MSSTTFSALDGYLWKLTYKWATFSHANKPTRWVVARYFGRFNNARRDRWVFGDRQSGAYLHRFAWTRIVRHQIADGAASPDDPARSDYWARRRRKTPLPIDKTSVWLLGAQNGRCAIWGDALFAVDDRPQSPPEWEQWLATTRKTVIKIAFREAGASETADSRLIRAHRRNAHHARSGQRPALLPAYEPTGLLEPDARKRARPVLI